MQQRDTGLVDDLTALTAQDYEFMRYSNDRSVKDAFIAGEVEEPNLRYGDIEPEWVEERLAHVAAFEEVVTAHSDELVRRAYLPKLREFRERFELLGCAQRGEDAGVLDASTRLYGAPQTQYFTYALRGLKERLERVSEALGGNERVREALSALTPLVGGEPQVYPWDAIELPTPRVYADAPPLSAGEIKSAFEEAFARYDVPGWRAVVDAPGERMTFNTNHNLHTVFIPSDDDLASRKYPLTRERVEALIAHEVGTHVVRRVRGEASPLALLGVGLAGYLRGEEGIATYSEQVLDGTRHFAGGFGYLAVGWAFGLDGTKRTFRQLYEVLRPYMLVSSIEHALSYDEPVDIERFAHASERRAWARCVRIFRGTSGTTPGACFTKDVVYLEGNIAIWQLVSADPSWPERFRLGKYDPANAEHVALLRDLDMLP